MQEQHYIGDQITWNARKHIPGNTKRLSAYLKEELDVNKKSTQEPEH